ncbi:MAG: DUF4381 domain-containing protein [Alphaproteobacteria bacterium]|nr:DUF4381 domain-containing protein [Alphaproteobacteria bacterium]
MQSEIDLSGLKDIHLPEQPTFFPPAIGWWIVLFFLLVVFLGGLFGYYKYYTSPKQYALRLLRQIMMQKISDIDILIDLGKLLKRIALIVFPRSEVASLSGQEWADFLFKTGNHSFSRKQTELISQAAYLPKQKAIAIHKEKLYTATRDWISSVFKGSSNGNQRKRYFKNYSGTK